MNNDSNLKNDQPKKAGEVNHELLPKITNDEIDLEVDYIVTGKQIGRAHV